MLVETLPLTPPALLRERVWLMHWALVVFFNDADTLNVLVEMFFSEQFINAIQTMAPHLLRYLACAILIRVTSEKITKSRQLNDCARYIHEERYTYNDPVTEFVRLLIRANDFEGASQMLKEAMDKVLSKDFFLWYWQDFFLENARLVFLKKYCRLYSRICLTKLASLLLMEDYAPDALQSWVVNAVKEEGINARLDVVKDVLFVKFGPGESNPFNSSRLSAIDTLGRRGDDVAMSR